MAWGGKSGYAARTGIAVIVIAGTATAQQSRQPGADFYLDLSTGITASDNLETILNPSGTSTALNTDIAFGFESVTKVQSLTARIGGRYELGEFADDPGTRGGFTDPFAQVSYARATGDAKLSFSASYRESDVSDITEIDEFTGEDLRLDGGKRESRNASLAFETGLRARFGVNGSAKYSDTTYSNASATSLVDSRRRDVDLGLRFDLTRTATLRLTTSYTEIETQNTAGQEERRYSTGLGLDLALTRALDLSLRIASARNEVEETVAGSRETTVEDSPTFGVTLTHALRNGTATATLSSALTSTGTQTTLTFGRAVTFKSGQLAASIGATETGSGDIRGVATLAAQRDFKTGSISANFRQSISTNADLVDEQNTQLRLGYSRRLSPLDGLNFSMSVSQSDRLDPALDDIQRTSAEVSYVRELTQDWSLNAGYRHSVARQTGRDPIVENRVFATIDRRFSLRP